MINQFGVVISLALLAWAMMIVIISIILFIYNVMLLSYLKKRRIKRWEQLTTIGSMGPGLSNLFRWFPYVYNEIDADDHVVLNYKKRIRFFLFILMSSLGILLISFMFLVLP